MATISSTAAPFGFRLSKGRAEYLKTYYVPSSDGTALFVGDVVKEAGDATADGFTPTVTKAAAGNTPIGVVTAVNQVREIDPTSLNLYRLHRPASTGMYVTVQTDPLAEYEVQSSGAVASADILLNADLTAATAGSTTTGLSGMALDISTKNTTSTLVFHINRFLNEPDNLLSDSFPVLVVTFNVHQLKSVGVAGN